MDCLPLELLQQEIVGVQQIASRLGTTPKAISAHQWRQVNERRGDFPPSRGKLGDRMPFWIWSVDIVPWAARHGLLEGQNDG